MKKVLLYVFPLYADFEIAHTLFFLRKIANAHIETVTMDGEPAVSLGGITTIAQLALGNANPDEYDLILLPGGDGIEEILDNETSASFLKEAHSIGIPIASICSSAALLGEAGILRYRKFTCLPHTYEQYKDKFIGAAYTGENVETRSNIITAKGTAFPEFTVAVGNLLGMWRNQQQAEKALQFCKGNG
ncbi:DJ-1/PfpI family protein [Oceanobacillus damuensis]|uniref:DJ-1/PfpI family protein n=1 Tax=Oceanobacillus damuensis TaxID=937928 RepID=UPI00082C522E|nr:DJ-1/PfpI family protein [Oceanobacillus damuensis]